MNFVQIPPHISDIKGRFEIDDTLAIRRLEANATEEISDLANFFQVDAHELSECVSEQSILLFFVEQKNNQGIYEKVGRAALENLDTMDKIYNRVEDKDAAERIYEAGGRYASSLYLDSEYCRKGIGSRIVKRVMDAPWRRQIFQLVDNKNIPSSKFQDRFGMEVIATIYVPSIFDSIFCGCKFGISGTAYQFPDIRQKN